MSKSQDIAALLDAGLAHQRAGRNREAEQAYRRALTIDPDHPGALALLATLAGMAGHIPMAVQLLNRALKRDPNNADIHHNLGESYRATRDFDNAETHLRRAIELNPDHVFAYRGIADLYAEEAKLQQANGKPVFAQQLIDSAVKYLNQAGERQLARRKGGAAADLFRAAIALDPNNKTAWAGVGHSYPGAPREAKPALERAVEIDPNYVWALGQLGNVYFALQQPVEAEAIFRRGLAVEPHDPACRQGLISVLMVDPIYRATADAGSIYRAHRQWGDATIAEFGSRPATPFAHARDPEKRLRVGFVSPDFREHSVTYFFEPLLLRHTKATEFFCYAEAEKTDEDAVTDRLRRAADHWQSTQGLSDDKFRDVVRADKIDVLIDLTGHMASNRLRAFAVKPAPVTATWLGYPATTGLSTMDWRITDAIADPEGVEAFHTEKLMRLPEGFLCYQPPAAPAVAPLPAASSGHVTFGSFNNHLKVNAAVVDAWASVLKAVPGSQLMLKGGVFDDAEIRTRTLGQFAARGIAEDRIMVVTRLKGLAEHLGAYGRVDIGLDPFPYNGTTTTCEALWMGVPVVTLIGDRHSGRVGLDLLTRVGLEKLAAADLDSYVRIAAELAGDLAALAELRTGLRARMERSPLCDAPRFARDFEAALRTMWRAYCESGVSLR